MFNLCKPLGCSWYQIWPTWVEFMVNTHFDLVSGGPDSVPTALKWSDRVKLMVTKHFDLISGPLRVPRGPKGVIWAQSLNFHVTIFLGILFVPNIGLWGVQTVAGECLAHPALL